MSTQTVLQHGVMEGDGAYNKHAQVQASGIALALPFLEKAIEKVELCCGNQPAIIADYGSSQGKNSLAPMRVAIRNLRPRLGSSHPIMVFHIDQPSNDFNSLFEVLDRDPERYALDEPNVFSSAIGRSFYEQVLPPESVDVGWSSYAAVWLSRVPTLISGHFRANRGTEAERAAFQRQAAEDWEKFLALRARELRPGGCLVVVLPALSDDGVPDPALGVAMDHTNDVLREMVDEDAITAEERARMVIASFARRRCDLLAPFQPDGEFHGLTVDCCELLCLADPVWAEYESDGDNELLAARQARQLRATFFPSLACALSNGTDDTRRAFADRLEDGVKGRLAKQPLRVRQLVQAMVLIKQRSSKSTHPIRAKKIAPGGSLGHLLHRQAMQRPDAPALFSNDAKISFRDLDESSTQLACWLIEQGLQPGDRVAIHWSNSIETVQIFFAIFKAGLIAVPINLRLKPPEVAWILEHSQSVLCFSQPALASIAEQARSGSSFLRHILTELPALTPHDASSLPEIHEEQPAAILYTSGSTARPKGVTHTHRTLKEGARLLADDLLNGEDIVLTMTPMMHALGLGCAVLPAVYLGVPAVLLPTFAPGAVLDAIERFRCTYTIGLPAQMQFVVEEQARKPRDTSSLRTVIAGGDAVPVKLQERFASLFRVPLHEGMGMTETYPVARNPKGAIRPGSLGLPMTGVQLGIVDDADRFLENGDTGEIVVRSPANCIGYWNDPAATDALFCDGWLHTGDLGTRDRDGYFWFKGRKKQIIVHGGSNISPQEVEEALYQHPAVLEAGVIGAPDPIYGEAPVAFVSLRDGAAPGEHELRECARKNLADYKVPQKIFFIRELPKGPTGKVHRSALKAMLITTAQATAS